MNDNTNNFNRFSLTLFWLFSFFVIIFMITLTAHASAYYNTDYFPMSQNQNSLISETQISGIENTFNSVDNYIFVANIINYSWGSACNVLVVPKSSDTVPYAEVLSNGYQFSIYNIGSGGFSVFCYVYFDGGVEPYGSDFGVYQNLTSSLYSTSVDYVSNFRIYTNGVDNEVVLNYGSSDPVVDVGVAIIPPGAFVPDYPSGITAPSQVPPTFTTSDYTWTTPPTFDGSSVENALGSIMNLIGWLSNNLKEEFKNLTDNLEGFFKYIGDTIQYYGNAIISTLNDFIQNFYDNMAALVQPIFEKIAYITEDVDFNEVSTAFNSTSFVGLKNQFNTFFTSFENAFDISEPNTFTLTINIQNIDTFYNFGCRSPVIIHLDEHFNPIKAALRTFLWILISFGSVFVVERGLSDWLRGENDTK